MLNQWFYSHSTWEVGCAVCLVLMVLPLIGLRIFHRLVPQEHREHDTPMVGLSYALCGGLYAVMLAFVAVGVYETMDRSTAIASNEANSLGSLAFDSAGLGAEAAERVRGEVEEYIDVVTKKEWPDQQAYRMEAGNFEKGWEILRLISVDLASFEPKTQGQASVKVEMEHAINDLFAERRTRLLAARTHLPDAVWQMLIFGLVMVAFYVYLFGPFSYRIHMAVTAMTMFSIGLVFTLVIALDYPFRGDVSVDCDAFTQVKEVAESVFPSTAAVPPLERHSETK
jgi:Protein of unknown function (DUF4239)